MAANESQVGGTHYKGYTIQHWDWAQNIGYLEGCATKYIARHKEKGGIEDLKKALHFMQKIVERDYPEHMLDANILEPCDYNVND